MKIAIKVTIETKDVKLDLTLEEARELYNILQEKLGETTPYLPLFPEPVDPITPFNPVSPTTPAFPTPNTDPFIPFWLSSNSEADNG